MSIVTDPPEPADREFEHRYLAPPQVDRTRAMGSFPCDPRRRERWPVDYYRTSVRFMALTFRDMQDPLTRQRLQREISALLPGMPSGLDREQVLDLLSATERLRERLDVAERQLAELRQR